VREVLPLNGVKIRYDQGLEEIVNADRLIKFNPRMLPLLKNLSTHQDFNPEIRVPAPLLAVKNAVQIGVDFEEEEMSAPIRIPKSKIYFEDQRSKRRTGFTTKPWIPRWAILHEGL
jgi:hypothetical protein